jgi:hypothetical protein
MKSFYEVCVICNSRILHSLNNKNEWKIHNFFSKLNLIVFLQRVWVYLSMIHNRLLLISVIVVMICVDKDT